MRMKIPLLLFTYYIAEEPADTMMMMSSSISLNINAKERRVESPRNGMK
jgi:hypothetical protein